MKTTRTIKTMGSRPCSRGLDCTGRSCFSRGFTLLYAVLISSILLAVGIAIFEITVRELRLSSVVRESEFAFYAADSGIECVLYWDVQATSSRIFYPGAPQSITCDGKTIDNVGGAAFGTPSTFSVDLPSSTLLAPDRCVSITVTKTALTADPDPPVRTVVDSRGYNVACAALATDSNAVERTLRVSY